MLFQYLSSLERAPQIRPHIPPVPGRTHLTTRFWLALSGRRYGGDHSAIEPEQVGRVVLEHQRPYLLTDRQLCEIR
jgi:hypothetical protein